MITTSVPSHNGGRDSAFANLLLLIPNWCARCARAHIPNIYIGHGYQFVKQISHQMARAASTHTHYPADRAAITDNANQQTLTSPKANGGKFVTRTQRTSPLQCSYSCNHHHRGRRCRITSPSKCIQMVSVPRAITPQNHPQSKHINTRRQYKAHRTHTHKHTHSRYR